MLLAIAAAAAAGGREEEVEAVLPPIVRKPFPSALYATALIGCILLQTDTQHQLSHKLANTGVAHAVATKPLCILRLVCCAVMHLGQVANGSTNNGVTQVKAATILFAGKASAFNWFDPDILTRHGIQWMPFTSTGSNALLPVKWLQESVPFVQADTKIPTDRCVGGDWGGVW